MGGRARAIDRCDQDESDEPVPAPKRVRRADDDHGAAAAAAPQDASPLTNLPAPTVGAVPRAGDDVNESQSRVSLLPSGRTRSTFAYATLVMLGDKYVPGALVLAWSLRQQKASSQRATAARGAHPSACVRR